MAFDPLALIRQYETGGGTDPNGANVLNYRYDPTHTASGYYQITNTNWQAYGPQLGIDTTQYPTAISGSFDQQTAVADYMLNNTPQGIGNWSNYNPQLANALNSQGGSGVTGGTSDAAPNGTYGPGGTMPQWQLDMQNGVANLFGMPPVSPSDNGATGTTGSSLNDLTGGSGSSDDWVTRLEKWLGSIASRFGLVVVGIVLLIGAVLMFSRNQT